MLDLVEELLQLQERSDLRCHSRQGPAQQLQLQGSSTLQCHAQRPPQPLTILPRMPPLWRQHPPVHQAAKNRRSKQMNSPGKLKPSWVGKRPTGSVSIVVQMIMSGRACPLESSCALHVLVTIGGWARTSRESEVAGWIHGQSGSFICSILEGISD